MWLFLNAFTIGVHQRAVLSCVFAEAAVTQVHGHMTEFRDSSLSKNKDNIKMEYYLKSHIQFIQKLHTLLKTFLSPASASNMNHPGSGLFFVIGRIGPRKHNKNGANLPKKLAK